MNQAPSPSSTSAENAQTVGILGLGLIGGSFARAYHAAGWNVAAFDTDADTLAIAMIDTIDSILDDETLQSCDLVILSAYPDACISWLQSHASALGDLGPNGPLVIDSAGVKGELCNRAFELACHYGFAFCGAHPMAGTEHSGYAHGTADLFEGAPMVLVPPQLEDLERLELLDRAHTLLAPCRFGRFSVTTPADHDRVIAFTSQLAHVVSNAYVKSPTAQAHHGFSAGSYKDLTRVAHLNPDMWSELMIQDADYLADEIEIIINALNKYRVALIERNREDLRELLAEGDRIKRALDDMPR